MNSADIKKEVNNNKRLLRNEKPVVFLFVMLLEKDLEALRYN